ncbi:helix-turn-helix domain-containing protein [Achromobacter insuavis]
MTIPAAACPVPLRDWLRRAAALRVRLLGICTGTFALAQADVIGPRTVCVHWNVLETFRERFPATRAVVDRLFVDEGDLISCAGSTAAIDLGLYLVARHCGRDKAQQAMRHMMLQGARPGRVPQAHFRTDLSGIQDLRVRQAAHFIEQRIDNPPPLDAIARYVGVGRRQLERAFRLATGMSPMAFQRQLRLEYGSWLLLNNACSITQIALDCGFADGAHFHAISARISDYLRASISKATGSTPRGTKARSASFPRSLAPARRTHDIRPLVLGRHSRPRRIRAPGA